MLPVEYLSLPLARCALSASESRKEGGGRLSASVSRQTLKMR